MKRPTTIGKGFKAPIITIDRVPLNFTEECLKGFPPFYTISLSSNFLSCTRSKQKQGDIDEFSLRRLKSAKNLTTDVLVNKVEVYNVILNPWYTGICVYVTVSLEYYGIRNTCSICVLHFSRNIEKKIELPYFVKEHVFQKPILKYTDN